jgi:S1-C subfamily serine protease/DNA-binding NarL/FixJ family response regulator
MTATLRAPGPSHVFGPGPPDRTDFFHDGDNMSSMRILVLNLSSDSAEEVGKALAGQGYEVATETGIDVEQVETANPELLITEATPSDLSCCGMITQIKSRTQTKSIRVLMIVQGGALERARALDLGADDVISSPFVPVEFAARVRTQFRERQPEEELRSKLKQAEEKEHLAELAVETLSGGAVARKRMWVLPAILVLCVIAVIAALVTSLTYRRSRTDTMQLKAEVARLNRGVVQQSDLLRRAEDERRSLEAQGKTESATRDSLLAQSADIKKKMASAGAGGDTELRQQLLDTQGRLNRLETEGKFAENIVRTYGSSVCLLHVIVEFLDRGTGKPILIAVDQLGKPILDDKGMVQLDVNGNGPHLQLDVFGTGFVVRKDGRLLTNHHVAEPWWGNDELKALIEHGASAYALSYTAYFPGNPNGIAAKLDKISPRADVATLRLDGGTPQSATLLDLDERSEASVAGDAVVLIGYPTGIEGILARAGTEAAKEITGNTAEVTQIVSHLADKKLIRPTTTQGHIGDILQDKIVYDAATTSGGSGGPLFNRSGKVIGVNFAILNGFGGSNLAVPVRYAKELLK